MYFLKVIVVVEGVERFKDSLITQQHGTLAVLDTRLRLFESFKVNTGVCHRSAQISRSTGSGQRQLVAAVIVPVTEASGRRCVLFWLKEGRKKRSFVIIQRWTNKRPRYQRREDLSKRCREKNGEK